MTQGLGADAPHLPRPAPIDAYGDGGFRFAGMSHRGSILCLPDGIWAWPIDSITALSGALLRPALERAASLDIFLIGAGRDPYALPKELCRLFHEADISIDCLATGPAAQTYNILFEEGRRVGAALFAV